MINPSSEFDAIGRDVSTEAASATAYAIDEAIVYDEKRLTTPAAKHIHEFERDLLLKAMRRVAREGRLLEIGCGTGRLLIEAIQRGYRVDGVDASGAMLERLKPKLPAEQDIDLAIADAANVPKQSATYDLVYSIRLLNQTESPAYALTIVTEMFRLAKPGGLILVEFVNDYRPRWGTAQVPRKDDSIAAIPSCKAGDSRWRTSPAVFGSILPGHAGLSRVSFLPASAA